MKNRKIVFKLLVITLSISIAIISFTGCGLYPKEEQMLAPPLVQAPKVTYEEISVTKGNVINSISGQGTLLSVSQTNLFFKFKGGTLKSINVKLGDVVKAGATVAELDTDNLESRIKQQDLSIRQAQLTVDDAKAQLAEDQKNEVVGSDKTRRSLSNVKQSEFNLEKNMLGMEDLQLEKQKSTLTSTIGGIVIYADSINAGDYANAFKTLVTLADPAKLQIQYTGDKLDAFELGKKVDIKYNNAKYVGTVVTNPSSMPVGTNKDAKKYVQIKVDNLPTSSLIGDSVDISFVVEKRENVIVLARNLINNSDGRNYVLMLEKGLKVERNVELGLQNGTDVEIIKGLTEGEKIIK